MIRKLPSKWDDELQNLLSVAEDETRNEIFLTLWSQCYLGHEIHIRKHIYFRKL